MQNTRYIGHIAALITIATWGTTFISTKVLLTGFQRWKSFFPLYYGLLRPLAGLS